MSTSVLQQKKQLRKEVLAQRKNMDADQKSEASSKMLKLLEKNPIFKKANCLHIFLPQVGEPDTRPIIELSWKLGKKVAVPCVLPGSMELFHAKLDSFEELVSGAYGILEPSPETRIAVPIEQFDLVIVPGVAFDQKGARMGYGKGYYDRFLSRTPAFRLAVCFDFQLQNQVPTEDHDLPMNGILTEKGIHFVLVTS